MDVTGAYTEVFIRWLDAAEALVDEYKSGARTARTVSGSPAGAGI